MTTGGLVQNTGISDYGYALIEQVCIGSIHHAFTLLSIEELQMRLVQLAVYIAELEEQ